MIETVLNKAINKSLPLMWCQPIVFTFICFGFYWKTTRKSPIQFDSTRRIPCGSWRKKKYLTTSVVLWIFKFITMIIQWLTIRWWEKSEIQAYFFQVKNCNFPEMTFFVTFDHAIRFLSDFSSFPWCELQFKNIRPTVLTNMDFRLSSSDQISL